MQYLKIITWLLFVFSMLLLVSCDPGQIIRIENTSGAAASIEFVFKKGKEYYEFEDLRNGEVLFLQLSPGAPDSVKDFHFGIGHWKVQGSLDSLVAMVESVEIKSASATITYSGNEQVQTFFEDRIEGRMDQMILISIN